MNNNLLILGAGQYGMVAKEIAESMGCFGKINFLDDNSELAIGKLSDYEQLVTEYSHAIVAIGNTVLRLSLIQKLEESLYRVAALVSPRAYVSPSARINKGCIVESMAVINTGSELAIGVLVSAGAVINHNSFIGDGCHINCNAVVTAHSLIIAGTQVGYGEIVGTNFPMDAKKPSEEFNFEGGM